MAMIRTIFLIITYATPEDNTLINIYDFFFDFLGLSYLWPLMSNCTTISKRENLFLPVFGLAFWLCGAIFVDRSNSKTSQKQVNETAEIIRNKKVT